jgi:hypothetical protein
MKGFTSELYARMSEELELLTFSSDNILQRSERSYHIVENTLKELKQFVVNYTFRDKNEEIEFFKEIKPMFLRELIYFMEVFQVESWKPPVGREDEITHYLLGAKRVDLYFKRYNDLYTYYRKGSKLHDELYFLRSDSRADLITPVSLSDIDHRFTTVHSFQFAKMQAYEQFSTYLEQCIYRLEHPDTSKKINDQENYDVNWTDPRVNLIELGWGIFVCNSVNNGKASLKLIMAVLSKTFNIDLGNYYAVIKQNIRSRKRKNNTHYLDHMIGAMLQRIEYLDESSGQDNV